MKTPYFPKIIKFQGFLENTEVPNKFLPLDRVADNLFYPSTNSNSTMSRNQNPETK